MAKGGWPFSVTGRVRKPSPLTALDPAWIDPDFDDDAYDDEITGESVDYYYATGRTRCDELRI